MYKAHVMFTNAIQAVYRQVLGAVCLTLLLAACASNTPTQTDVPTAAPSLAVLLTVAQNYEERLAQALGGGELKGLTPNDVEYVKALRDSGKIPDGVPQIDVRTTAPEEIQGDEVQLRVITALRWGDNPVSVQERTLTLQAGSNSHWQVVATLDAIKGEADSLSTLAITDSAQIIARAQKWVDAKVPYDQNATRDGYRTDCSGFVSYAWGLQPNGLYVPNTVALSQYATQISKNDLRPGDAINNQRWGNDGHVILFKAWINQTAGTFVALQENGEYGSVQSNLTLVLFGSGWTVKEFENATPAKGPYVFQRVIGASSGGGTPTPLPSGTVQFQRAGTNLTLNGRPYPGMTYTWLYTKDATDQEQIFDVFRPGTFGGNQGFMYRRRGTNSCLNTYQPHALSDVILYTCSGSDPDQQWEPLQNGSAKLLRNLGRGFCLNAYTPTVNRKVTMWACDFKDGDQAFSF
ncbi:ricin-type beta-trefoil lectin domain protein [Deinococcus sp.]|uniref:ricin-type beta-trefoil lectin domain protein n=1 Tax=Deinococcus sp. TaxID=47478 RepID=UPI003CC6182E